VRRRAFILALGGAAAAWPLAARAQPSSVPRIGILYSASASQFLDVAFQHGLRDGGLIEGQNVRIESRWAGGVYERLPALAAELVALRVDVMVAIGTPAVHAAKLHRSSPILRSRSSSRWAAIRSPGVSSRASIIRAAI